MVRRLITRGAFAGLAIVATEAAYAVLRPSPSLDDFDPSGTFGHKDSPPLRVAVLGDSTVTAPGVGNADNTWARIVSRQIADSGFSVELKSWALSGSRTRDVIDSQLEPALLWRPDLAFVSIGANDLLHGGRISRFEADLDELIAELSRSVSTVVQNGLGDLGTIPRLVPPLRTLVSRRSDMFDRVHAEVASRHGTVVVAKRIDSRQIWIDDRELWAEDLFHMSAKGHARAARFIWMTVEPLLGHLNAAI